MKVNYDFLRSKLVLVTILLLIVITLWWAYLSPFTESDSVDLTYSRYVWGASYQIIALWGGVVGLLTARRWGGISSVLGRSINAFSLGLLFQVFGQIVYSYYNIFAQIEAPYPSLGDIGFFGSIPLYIYGAFLLARVSGTKVSLRSFVNQTWAVIIPVAILTISYWMFLTDYTFDWSAPLTVILDFGYPVGQAIYVSVAILALLLSRGVLGGIMKLPIFFLLIALLVQYCSDFNFLYQVHNENWFVGGYGDYLYTLSYFLMALALIYMGHILRKLSSTSKISNDV